jgi:hypothetical protein
MQQQQQQQHQQQQQQQQQQQGNPRSHRHTPSVEIHCSIFCRQPQNSNFVGFKSTSPDLPMKSSGFNFLTHGLTSMRSLRWKYVLSSSWHVRELKK